MPHKWHKTEINQYNLRRMFQVMYFRFFKYKYKISKLRAHVQTHF
jgi:hypothetical protein